MSIGQPVAVKNEKNVYVMKLLRSSLKNADFSIRNFFSGIYNTDDIKIVKKIVVKMLGSAQHGIC